MPSVKVRPHDEPHQDRAHIPALDGIRGIAISLVVIYHAVHFGGIQRVALVDRIFARMSEAGWVGVDLFFVLSGFLITGILDEARGGDGYFRNFYARRVLRIFPLYYGFLSFLFIILPRLTPPSPQFLTVLKDQAWYWAYLINVFVAFHGWHPGVPEVGHFWSLAIEEQFYLIWPWMVFVLSRRTLVRVCLGIMLGSFCLRLVLQAAGMQVATYVLTPARMDALALGGLLSLLARESGGLSHLTRWAQLTVAGSGVLLVTLFVWRLGFRIRDPLVMTIGLMPLALFFAGILVIAVESLPGTLAGKVFAHRFLRSLGRYSYALYIFHLPIIIWISPLYARANIPMLEGSNLPAQVLFIALAGAISLGAAVVSWHLYETQFLKLKTLFPRKAKE